MINSNHSPKFDVLESRFEAAGISPFSLHAEIFQHAVSRTLHELGGRGYAGAIYLHIVRRGALHEPTAVMLRAKFAAIVYVIRPAGPLLCEGLRAGFNLHALERRYAELRVECGDSVPAHEAIATFHAKLRAAADKGWGPKIFV